MKFLLFFMTLFLSGSLWSNSWVIVANGSHLPLKDLKGSLQDRKILVLDGAINRFKSLSLYPDYLLGDFDSVEDPTYWGISEVFSEMNETSPPYKGHFGITIIPAKDQNYTDLEKGIIYADQAGATSICIIQATGGRMDHTLGNLGILKKYHRAERDLILITEQEQIFYVCNKDILVSGGVGEYCAIMGYPEARMTTSGLTYNGSDYLLQLGVQESICNTIADPKATISIKGEALIILPKSCAFKIKK